MHLPRGLQGLRDAPGEDGRGASWSKGSEQKGIDVKSFYLWRAETYCISVNGKVTELEKTRDGFGKFDKKKKRKLRADVVITVILAKV